MWLSMTVRGSHYRVSSTELSGEQFPARQTLLEARGKCPDNHKDNFLVGHILSYYPIHKMLDTLCQPSGGVQDLWLGL